MINEKLRSSLGLETADTVAGIDYDLLSMAISNEMHQLDVASNAIRDDIVTLERLVDDYISLENLYSVTKISTESLNDTNTKLLSVSLENIGRKYGIVSSDLNVSNEGVVDFISNTVKAIIKKINDIVHKSIKFGNVVAHKLFNPTKKYAKEVLKRAKRLDGDNRSSGTVDLSTSPLEITDKMVRSTTQTNTSQI